MAVCSPTKAPISGISLSSGVIWPFAWSLLASWIPSMGAGSRLGEPVCIFSAYDEVSQIPWGVKTEDIFETWDSEKHWTQCLTFCRGSRNVTHPSLANGLQGLPSWGYLRGLPSNSSTERCTVRWGLHRYGLQGEVPLQDPPHTVTRCKCPPPVCFLGRKKQRFMILVTRGGCVFFQAAGAVLCSCAVIACLPRAPCESSLAQATPLVEEGDVHWPISWALRAAVEPPPPSVLKYLPTASHSARHKRALVPWREVLYNYHYLGWE